MRQTLSLPRSVLLFALIFASAAVARGQDTASLRGTVTDQSGGVIVGAKITLTNTKTNISRTATSGNDGGYLFTSVIVGTYSLTVSHASFQTSVQTNIVLELNQNGRVDVALKLGESSQTVEVTAVVAQVDTASAVLGKVEDERAIRDMPLLDRDTLQLGLLQAGVFAPDPDDTRGNPFSVSGQRSESLTFLLDGANNTDFLGNNIVVSPNPDAVQEFKILTNNYDAEYGRTSGGIVNQITKSGTNAFHGDIFEFLRNDALNARDYFAGERSSFKRNVFGATGGGPIKKDKTFFFLAYQGARRREGQTPTPVAVLSPTERTGDFGDICPEGFDGAGNCGNPDNQLINPVTGANLPFNNLDTAGLVNPTIQKYINQFLPMPNVPGSNNFEASPVASINDDQGIVHVDHNLTQHDVLSFVYVIDDSRDFFPEQGGSISTSIGPQPNGQGGNVPLGSGGGDKVRTQIGTLTWTHNFDSGKLNEFRFATSRYATLQAVPSDTTSPQDFGFTNVVPDDPLGAALPIVFGPSFTIGPSSQGPTKLRRATFEWEDNFTWTRGRHEIKFGGDITRIRQNYHYDFYNNGSFDFTFGEFTGNEYADFVGGFWDNYFQFSQALYGIRASTFAGYLQDTWKILPRLTLSYGLRYEFNTPQRDIHNNILGFFPGQQSTKFPGAPPDILYPGDPGTPNDALVYPDKNNFAPRLGFAWDMFGNAKLVMRGGFGIFYDIEDGALNLQFGGQPPFGFVANNFPNDWLGASGDIVSDPFTPLGLSQPFPATFTGQFFVPSLSFAYTTFPHFRTPYSENFNYGFQWQATKDLMVEAVYVGSLGRKLVSTGETNFPVPSVMMNQLATYGEVNPECARPLAACTGGTLNPSDPNDPSGSPTAAGQLLTNFSNGVSDSHQFQLTVDKRLSHGLQLRAAYTLAKTVDLSSGFRARSGEFTDPLDYNLDRAVADFDTPQRLVFSWLWEVPFNQLVHSDGFMKKVVEGWQFNGIASFQRGNPLTFFSNSNASQQNQFPDLTRTDVIGKVPYVNPRNSQNSFGDDCNGGPTTGNFWIDPTNMVCTPCPTTDPNCILPGDGPGIPLFTFGNFGRNTLRGPGINNWDLSITKKTKIGETREVEFRAEFFNAFNHTQFLRVDDAGGSATFGQVISDRGPRLIQFGLKFYF